PYKFQGKDENDKCYGFWKAFTELLKSNRQQYSQETITALEQ
ncbi:5989_t:CDS:1, partial [Racocetra persica]